MALRVLLVCAGNTCRSSMAEALLRNLAMTSGISGLEVRSAGVSAVDGAPASEHAITVMRERGLDLANHRSARLTKELVEWADLIFTMTRSQKSLVKAVFQAGAKVFTLHEYAGDPAAAAGAGEGGASGEIGDPWGKPAETYREVAAQIEEALKHALGGMQDHLGADREAGAP